MIGKVNEKTLSDLLYRIYSFPEKGDFFDHVLSVLEDYIPAAITGYSFTNLDTRNVERQVAHDLRSGSYIRPAGITAFAKQHPFYDYYISRSLSPVITITDVMSEDEWKETDVYNQLHRKYGVVHDASVRFYAGSRCISFAFSGNNPLRSDHRRLLNLIAPHLGNAYQSYTAQREGIRGHLPQNMILLDAEGRLLQLPSRAADIVSKYFPQMNPGMTDKLPDAIEQWIRNACNVFRDHAGDGGCPDKFTARNGDSMLTLGLIRHADSWLVVLEEQQVKRPYKLLMAEGLTQRESEILLWSMQGKKNQDIATILEITAATVRKHVEHILQKLDCETRGAAAQTAMQIVYRQSGSSLSLQCVTCARTHCQICY